jgi:hypothetical protein
LREDYGRSPGEIRDQSHLYGVLDMVRGLGLELVSVEALVW